MRASLCQDGVERRAAYLEHLACDRHGTAQMVIAGLGGGRQLERSLAVWPTPPPHRPPVPSGFALEEIRLPGLVPISRRPSGLASASKRPTAASAR